MCYYLENSLLFMCFFLGFTGWVICWIFTTWGVLQRKEINQSHRKSTKTTHFYKNNYVKSLVTSTLWKDSSVSTLKFEFPLSNFTLFVPSNLAVWILVLFLYLSICECTMPIPLWRTRHKTPILKNKHCAHIKNSHGVSCSTLLKMMSL